MQRGKSVVCFGYTERCSWEKEGFRILGIGPITVKSKDTTPKKDEQYNERWLKNWLRRILMRNWRVIRTSLASMGNCRSKFGCSTQLMSTRGGSMTLESLTASTVMTIVLYETRRNKSSIIAKLPWRTSKQSSNTPLKPHQNLLTAAERAKALPME